MVARTDSNSHAGQFGRRHLVAVLVAGIIGIAAVGAAVRLAGQPQSLGSTQVGGPVAQQLLADKVLESRLLTESRLLIGTGAGAASTHPASADGVLESRLLTESRLLIGSAVAGSPSARGLTVEDVLESRLVTEGQQLMGRSGARPDLP